MQTEHDPNNDGVIDQMLNAIYETETFNHHAHQYAIDVLHHYFGDFSDEWFKEWIETEEFRKGTYPTYPFAPMPEDTLRMYERMYDMYWDARCEWFNIMIANINSQNLREQNRIMFLHTLTNPLSCADYSKAAQAAPRINHMMKDE